MTVLDRSEITMLCAVDIIPRLSGSPAVLLRRGFDLAAFLYRLAPLLALLVRERNAAYGRVPGLAALDRRAMRALEAWY